MALAVSEAVAEVAVTTNAQSYATGSFTPAADSLLVAIFHTQNTAINGGISGGSLTWDQRLINVATHVSGIYTAQVGASPSSMTVTFDCTGDAASGCVMYVFQVTGHNTSAPVPQAAVRKTGVSANTPTLDFGSNLDTNNAYCVILINSTNPVGVTDPASFTNIGSGGFNTPTTGHSGAYRVNGETGTTLTWGGAGASAWITQGIEIAVAAGAPFPPWPQPVYISRSY